MRKMLPFGRWSKHRRNESRRPLIEKNNNDIRDGYNQAGNRCDDPSTQNTLNTHEEQHLQGAEEITLQELAALLGVAPDVITCETSSGQQNLSVVLLMQRSVSRCFPKPPADLHQNLQQHLSNVQETVCNELLRLGPLLQTTGLMGCLIESYHRQTFDHLSDLLQNIRSSHDSLVLMKWVLHTYLSQELLGHPDLQKMGPMEKVDLLLFAEWVTKAKDKLLEHVQTEVGGFLEKILQTERNQKGHDHEEDVVGLYVDIIQCVDAVPKEAQKLSSELSDRVREVCFQELLTFLERYTTEQTEILGKKAQTDKPETIHFFKTLITCKELKQHVLANNKAIKRSLLQETVATLENMEAFTLKLLMEIVADFAESHLKSYFKTENKDFFFLILRLKACFPELSCCQDVQKRVMDEVYKVIAHIYLKRLIRRSQSKLTRRWSQNVGQTVTEDAILLHGAISDLAPGVKQWNLMLLKISELLECESTDTVKLTVASMQKECLTWRDDLDLLPTLLRWKGLSGWQVTEVLDALPGPQSRPRSWFSGLTCC